VHFGEIESVDEETCNQPVYLRPLSDDEVMSIELFALADGSAQGGLSGLREPRRYSPDAVLNEV
jgi:hypothetical protein